jgi:peptidoglycan/xylan/chitin deacetylase (PgdA/CDA1 family)
MAGRVAAVMASVLSRGRARRQAWMVHDALWLYPTLRRNCDWHGEVLTRMKTSAREVWLTIDDGPDAHDTPLFLDLLARHDAKATFFAIGRKAEQNRALCRRICAEGHEIGNHTFSHPAAFWWTLPRPWVRREIRLGQEAILAATGRLPKWFRSPVGMNTPGVHPTGAAHGLRVVGWSADGCDGGCPAAPTHIAARIMSRVKPGSIILLHESGGHKHRALTLRHLLEALRDEGYRCVLPEAQSLY